MRSLVPWLVLAALAVGLAAVGRLVSTAETPAAAPVSGETPSAVAEAPPSPSDLEVAAEDGDVPVLAPPRPDAPAATSASAASPGSPAGPAPLVGEGALRLRVSVQDPCWLEILGDGEVLTTGLKSEGFRGEFAAQREVRLWVGNAGGVSLWINGQPLRSLGASGEVRRDVTITPDNYMDFVAREATP